ncbi:hypothetical protein GT360_18280 [Vibrio astriarenae]|uniref:Alginate lyase domain-containing protein n=1 Tax=Vibrio astriarenae TaxID=1481923 RepID=A0A7Z2T772_9VIBR|nr:alginate lyase family protein [Vibrio astriarenae]QIA65486.1 hypothetical protein GT360_18280 [Vibrio astriarenae]
MKNIIATTLMVFSMSSVADQIDLNSQLTYINIDKIVENREKIDNQHALYTTALKNKIELAEKALESEANPVTNKPRPGPSGSLNDYVSIGPYWWPDDTKADGLPWIRKDGQVNPLTRGDNTDQKRTKSFLTDLEHLNIAYLYTNDAKYMEKALELIDIWLVSPKTKMNPNLNYAQGVPGDSDGRPFGIIEFVQVSNIVTSMELLEESGIASPSFLEEVELWLTEYLAWLQTSELGQQESTRLNNHGTWYDVQVLGLMMYLGQLDQAKSYAEQVKFARISSQIAFDGSQPHELGRTKSVNYSSMNLTAFLIVSELASKVGVDLVNYEGPQGQSIKKAAEYMIPYVEGQKEWTYKQLGDLTKAFNQKTIPALFIANSVFDEELIANEIINSRIDYVDEGTLLMY